jgi:hypothetical protein
MGHVAAAEEVAVQGVGKRSGLTVPPGREQRLGGHLAPYSGNGSAKTSVLR